MSTNILTVGFIKCLTKRHSLHLYLPAKELHTEPYECGVNSSSKSGCTHPPVTVGLLVRPRAFELKLYGASLGCADLHNMLTLPTLHLLFLLTSMLKAYLAHMQP